MTDRWVYVLAVVLFAVVIAVADMNWPSHMGPQNVLMDRLASLITQ